MDNIIQNININDIVPTDNNNINSNELNELVNSIQKFGIFEPLLVRPKNGKYEIVLGNKTYKAARLAGINFIPSIVKEIDDNIIDEYRAISNLSQDDNRSIDSIKKTNGEIFNIQNSINNKKDIVNLSELNKEENEREDVKMNNELNNNMMNNNIGANPNIGANTAEPTFGGKFFPSLEDEPTNMNMGGMTQTEQPMTNNMSTPVNPVQPNLIDLTENNNENLENNISSVQTENDPQAMDNQQVPFMNNANVPMDNPMSQELDNQPNNIGNTINLGNLTSNYEQSPQPIEEKFQNNNMNYNMEPQNNEQIPQFDMSQAIGPNPVMSPDIGLGINANTVDPSPITEQTSYNPSIDMGLNNENINYQNNDMIDNQIPAMPNQMPLEQQPMMNNPIDNIAPVDNPIPNPMENNQDIPEENKNALVIKTIKELAYNLEMFGYKINVIEEETPTSDKITVEIEK